MISTFGQLSIMVACVSCQLPDRPSQIYVFEFEAATRHKVKGDSRVTDWSPHHLCTTVPVWSQNQVSHEVPCRTGHPRTGDFRAPSTLYIFLFFKNSFVASGLFFCKFSSRPACLILNKTNFWAVVTEDVHKDIQRQKEDGRSKCNAMTQPHWMRKDSKNSPQFNLRTHPSPSNDGTISSCHTTCN